MNNNKKNVKKKEPNDEEKNKNINMYMNENSLGPEESANLSKIEFKNQSINSSLKSLSRGEEFIQKDILQVLNGQQTKKNGNNYGDQIAELSMENSFHSKGSKNFVLKSDYLNNTNNSRHNSKKNLSFYDTNGMNQKSLFRNSVSFVDQEDDENKRERLKSINVSEKELDNNLFNNIIFNDANENNNWNKAKSNHSNIVQEYYQNIGDNIELFNNMNLSNNDINEQNNLGSSNEKNNNENKNNINLNYFINSNDLSTNGIQSNNSQNNIYNNQNDFVNNINNDYSNQNNIVNINPSLSNQNNFNNQLILNSFNNSNNNSQNQNLYYSNINKMKNNNIFNQNNSKNDVNLLMLKKKEENLINNCVTLCKEQMECRLLQKKIDEDPTLASEVIYDKIKDKVQEISCDQFGNYFFNKIFSDLIARNFLNFIFVFIIYSLRG